MDIVVLLGAGAEPAQSIARRLVGLGARVYGLANQFPERDGFSHRDFVRTPVNPADPAAVREAVERIASAEGAVNAVILAGHHPVDDAFESSHPNDVALAVFAGLAAPLAAVRAAMPGLVRRRGLVMAITRPVFGPGAALGGVVEAGLAAFCDGVFGETRDTGARVCHLRIQENPGPADPASRYTAAPQSRVQPDIVADTVESVMRLRENNAITRLVLRPQATREEPRLPVTSEPKLASLQVVQLPTSKNYPPAEQKIFTPEYRRPDYAPPPEERDEAFEDEGDDAVDPELAYLIKPRHRDRFVRDTSASEETAEAPADEPSEADGEEPVMKAPAREERPEAHRQAPEHRREPRQEQNRYHNPYAPQPPRQQQKPPRHGALRIQPPATENAAGEPGRNAPRPNVPADPSRMRFEQMPRPRDWQGPRYPQQQPQQQQNNRPPQAQPAPKADRGPDLHPGYRKAQEERAAREAASSREHPAHTPRIVTDAEGRPVGGLPESSPRPAPVIVPVESGRHADESPKTPAGRSEAVTLSFATKEQPATVPSVPAPEVREKVVKAERDEELDEAPVKIKKRPAVKKTAAKADKAVAKAEASLAEEPDAAEAEEKSAKPKRKPAAKKKAE